MNRKAFKRMDATMLWIFKDGLFKKQINSILTNDFGLDKLKSTVIPKKHWKEFQKRRDEWNQQQKEMTV